jgi:hypothetical protein
MDIGFHEIPPIISVIIIENRQTCKQMDITRISPKPVSLWIKASEPKAMAFTNLMTTRIGYEYVFSWR